MYLELSQIGPEGLEKTYHLAKSWLAEVLAGAGTVDFRPAGDCQVQLRAERVATGVHLRGGGTLQLVADCAACLEDFALELPLMIEMQLRPRPPALPEPPVELELSSEDLDEAFYDGDAIDVGRILHEQIVLALPLYPRCRPDCLGLCPQCGANRNREPCSCQDQVVDPRWAALRNLAEK